MISIDIGDMHEFGIPADRALFPSGLPMEFCCLEEIGVGVTEFTAQHAAIEEGIERSPTLQGVINGRTWGRGVFNRLSWRQREIL